MKKQQLKAPKSQRRDTRSGAGFRLTDDTVRDIRTIYAAMRDNPTDDDGNPIGQTELKRRIGASFDPPVSHMTVHNVVTGKSHRRVDGPVFPTADDPAAYTGTVVTITTADGDAVERLLLPPGWGVSVATVTDAAVADVRTSDTPLRDMHRVVSGRRGAAGRRNG